ncbi:HLH-domain-containing protein [Rhizopus microsporus var. microsporus]|nr:HLH-domain-containing protein [Rhizopus microsporus var. microsporus]
MTYSTFKDIPNDSVVNLLAQHSSNHLNYSNNDSLYQDNYVFDDLYPRKSPSSSPPQGQPMYFNGRLRASSSYSSFQNNDLFQQQQQQKDDSHSFDEEYINQANMQAIMEKRRRRRESHNAVERRRRDNINERIQELGTLLPDSAEENKMNKGTILRKSVEQIRKLQHDVYQHKQRIHELELLLQQLRRPL